MQTLRFGLVCSTIVLVLALSQCSLLQIRHPGFNDPPETRQQGQSVAAYIQSGNQPKPPKPKPKWLEKLKKLPRAQESSKSSKSSQSKGLAQPKPAPRKGRSNFPHGEKHGLLSCEPRTRRVHARKGRQVIEIDCLNIVKCRNWGVERRALDILKWWVDACEPICRCGPYDRDLHQLQIVDNGKKKKEEKSGANGEAKKWSLGPYLKGWGPH